MNRTDASFGKQREGQARTRGPSTPLCVVSLASRPAPALSWWGFALLCLAPFLPALVGLVLALP